MKCQTNVQSIYETKFENLVIHVRVVCRGQFHIYLSCLKSKDSQRLSFCSFYSVGDIFPCHFQSRWVRCTSIHPSVLISSLEGIDSHLSIVFLCLICKLLFLHGLHINKYCTVTVYVRIFFVCTLIYHVCESRHGPLVSI